MGLFDLFKKKKETPMSGMQIIEMKNEDFMFNINAFNMTDRGLTLTGFITGGMVLVGDTIKLKKADGTEIEVQVIGIGKEKEVLEVGYRGESLDIMINNVTIDQITHGDMLIKKKF